MKAVLFATGPTDFVVRQTEVLCSRVDRKSLKVVAPVGSFAEVREALKNYPEVEVQSWRLINTPALLMRLWLFLGFSPAEVSCLSCGGPHRLLKLIAHGLRGWVVFVRPDGRAPLGFRAFLWIYISRLWSRDTGALLVGCASPETLTRLEEDIRNRRPGSQVSVLRDPSLADFLRVIREWRRYYFLSIPWTNEGHNLLKAAAMFLPCGRREIYNEMGDSFSVRRVGVVLKHIERRTFTRQNGAVLVGCAGPATLARFEDDLKARRPGAAIHVVRTPGDFFAAAWHWRRYRFLSIPWTNEGHNLLKAAAWLLPCGRREIYNEQGDSFSVRRVDVVLRHIVERLPHGITVLGSASGYYLKDIVATLRQRHPGEPIHGLLPPRLVKPAGHLFDSVTILRVSSIPALIRRGFGKERTGRFIIPCTNEGYNLLKLTGWLLPMGRREIFNENHDGYALRSWPMVYKHIQWRLYHRMFYQAITERNGRSWPAHLFHLLVYPARLVAGAALLLEILVRAKMTRPAVAAEKQTAQPQQVLDSAER